MHFVGFSCWAVSEETYWLLEQKQMEHFVKYPFAANDIKY